VERHGIPLGFPEAGIVELLPVLMGFYGVLM